VDRIDVLGEVPEREFRFTRDLLAETNDEELQEIVKKAAEELSSPIALVSLVLDQIQFFKAFVGLPPALATARGTHRDASFCQFVVRDGKAFEVTDAPNDPRVPQHVVKEFNINAYLGVPIKVEETVVGSLCVLDTKKRAFSETERDSLDKLAVLVNERLEAITKHRRQTRLDLTESAIQPGLIELSETLKPIQHSINDAYSANASVRSFLNLAQHLASYRDDFNEAFRLGLDAAVKANVANERSLCDIETATADCGDYISAMEHLSFDSGLSPLSEIVTSAQDLTRPATKAVGGFPLPEFFSDPYIRTKRTLSIAIITNCILAIAAELEKIESRNGIRLSIIEHDESIELNFSTPDLGLTSDNTAIDKIIDRLGTDPSVNIGTTNNGIMLTFKTAEANPSE
jgi:hypothetical protein